jgi:hypothetical protein
VHLAAIPARGYRFVSWIGDVPNRTRPFTTVTMSANKTVRAFFARRVH